MSKVINIAFSCGCRFNYHGPYLISYSSLCERAIQNAADLMFSGRLRSKIGEVTKCPECELFVVSRHFARHLDRFHGLKLQDVEMLYPIVIERSYGSRP